MPGRLKRFALEASLARWVFATAAANTLTAVLGTAIVTLLLADKSTPRRIIYGLVGVMILLASAWLLGSATKIREAEFPKNADIVLGMIRAISKASRRENEWRVALRSQVTAEDRRRTLIRALKTYMAELEEVLSKSWSTRRFGETTPVEVVLMKKASDGQVTVASWATTRPTSLDQRVGKPEFYNGTEAARLYRKYVDRGTRSPILLISDISKYEDYDHFGRDPSLRTNSTALFPLYDSDSHCHGFVAVTARNRAGMFRVEDRPFWDEVWTLWEPNLVRCVVDFEATGEVLDEEKCRM
ncbi:hypothetical protein ACIBL8_47080 [Streptomyces sp. NPDC050523]|uniref:hypothetical protein n=1 Tax=Streptomyces sp. NPDC050523 TaxID=3365622 RepID=UPI0037A76DDD